MTASKTSTLRRLIAITHQHGVQLAAHLRALERLNAARRRALARITLGHRQIGLDYTGLNPARARQLGASFVCRYLSHDPSKNLTRGEAQAIRAHGMSRVVVWETTADRASQGFQAGVQDANQALQQAVACGMPSSRPIYFAVDFDASLSDVASYFDGVKHVLGLHRTGAYGGIRVIRGLFDSRRITFGWQTYAWSGGQWDPRAQLQQYDNNNPDYDWDRTRQADFGQW